MRIHQIFQQLLARLIQGLQLVLRPASPNRGRLVVREVLED